MIGFPGGTHDSCGRQEVVVSFWSGYMGWACCDSSPAVRSFNLDPDLGSGRMLRVRIRPRFAREPANLVVRSIRL